MNFRFFIIIFLFIYNNFINIYSVNKNLKCDWSWIIKDLEKMVSGLDDKAIRFAQAAYTSDPYCGQLAQIRRSNNLCQDEINFYDNRILKIKSALEQLLGKQIDQNNLPKIAIASSGGGYRAMLNLLGSLSGAQATGLLDAILYMSGVSGSTWMMSSWIQSGSNFENLKNFYIKQLQTNFITYNLDYESVTSQLLCKWLFNEPYSLTDIYGMLLGQHLLGVCDKAIPLNLSYQSQLIQNGNYPLPIYSAVIRSNGYQWLEFTPFEVGSEYLNTFIPTWSFGREFKSGLSINFNDKYAPCLPLSFCLGTWASAFAYLVAGITKTRNIETDLKIEEEDFMEDVLTSRVCNWNYSVDNAVMQNDQYLQLGDSGIFINYDLNALLRRQADIIIILDASTNWRDITQLQHAEAYWRQFYKLPIFDYTNILNNVCTVFKDKTNPDLPVIIYMPQIKNSASSFDPSTCLNNFCNTFSFVYTQDQIQKITDNAELNMLDATSVILSEISEKVAYKSSRK